MEKRIFERYSHTKDGKFIIDIAAPKIEDLYNNYDKFAPYLKKDLEQGVVDYIVDSVNDLGNESFSIQFSIEAALDNDSISRLKMSVSKYFLYLQDLEIRELKKMFRTSLILFLIGIVILTLSVWVNLHIEETKTIINRVFAEGLTVAAWVSLWEALATFLVNWMPHRRQLKLYERIIHAPILFKETPTI